MHKQRKDKNPKILSFGNQNNSKQIKQETKSELQEEQEIVKIIE